MIDIENFREEYDAAIALSQDKSARQASAWGKAMADVFRCAATSRRPRIIVVMFA